MLEIFYKNKINWRKLEWLRYLLTLIVMWTYFCTIFCEGSNKNTKNDIMSETASTLACNPFTFHFFTFFTFHFWRIRFRLLEQYCIESWKWAGFKETTKNIKMPQCVIPVASSNGSLYITSIDVDFKTLAVVLSVSYWSVKCRTTFFVVNYQEKNNQTI